MHFENRDEPVRYCYSISTYSSFSKTMKICALLVILAIHTQLSHCWFRPKPPKISSPEECARNCTNGEPPKNCYYQFVIEFYGTMGPACDKQDQLKQCILGDGVEKTLIPINRQLPGPSIEVCIGDRIIVDVLNAAMGLEITIHWHGIFQNGYQYYDGVPFVTQCPIPSSTTFRYDFVVQNSGTHFYHSHVATHLLDGQYGPLIIRNPPNLEKHYGFYDIDSHVILLSDWMHELSLERFPGWYRHDIGQSAKNILINGLGNWTDPDTQQTTNGRLAKFTVRAGLRYRFRIINSFSTVCLAELRVEGHNLTVIAQDGADVKPKEVSELISSAGERVDFVLNANQNKQSYWIQVRGLGECADKQVQQLAILQYEGAPETPLSPRPSYNTGTAVVYNSLDGTKCNTNDTSTAVCVNQLEGLECDPDLFKVDPDERHILNFWFFNYTEYGNRLLFETNTYKTFFDANDFSQLTSTFNNISFESPASPLISQRSSYRTVCKPNAPSTCTEPCTCTQVINVRPGAVAEFVIYDQIPLTDLHHPFHLHGYEFKVFSIGQFTNGKNVSRADIDEVIGQHTQRLQNREYQCPPGKDTVKIPTGGYVIFRFKADNPGYWLLHCHFTWHHITGMELVVKVGDRYDLPPVPEGFPKCDNWVPPLRALNDFYGFRYPNLD